MKQILTVGMFTGGGVALCGPLLFVYERASQSSAPIRIWNLLRWLRIGLPVTIDPRLVRPMLGFLNSPLWLATTVVGLYLVASFWLMRVVDS